MVVTACAEMATPTAPNATPPTSTTPQTNPQTTPQTTLPVTGIVFEATSGGRRPVSGAHVFIVDLLEGPYGDYGWYESVTEPDGIFTISNVLRGRSVKITAYEGHDSGLGNQLNLNQVCAVHPIIDGNTTADVELVRDGRVPTTYRIANPVWRCVRHVTRAPTRCRCASALQQLQSRRCRRLYANGCQRSLQLLPPATEYRVRACRMPWHAAASRD